MPLTFSQGCSSCVEDFALEDQGSKGSRLQDRILSGLGKGRVEGSEAALSRTLSLISQRPHQAHSEPQPGEQPHTGHMTVLWTEKTLADRQSRS